MKRFQAKLWASMALVTGSLALVAGAASASEVWRSQAGQVQAELSYERVDALQFTNIRLQITRGGTAVLNAAVPVDSPYDRPLVEVSTDTFRVVDLDGDREPEVLLDLYTGGAHCCTYSLIYRYNPASNQYTAITHQWGNRGYRLRDLDNQPETLEFESEDDRFAYEFTAYAASAYPLQIWRYQGGTMQDVTLNFPELIYQHAAALWQAFDEQRRSGIDSDGLNVKGLLAAYLASKYQLGQAADGWQRVRTVYRLGDRQQFFNHLSSFLRATGYAR